MGVIISTPCVKFSYSLTGSRQFSTLPVDICPPIFLGNDLFETRISPIQRKTFLINAYTSLILAQLIFETFIFVITTQKISSDSPVSIHLLCTFNKSNQNGGLPIPLGICLLEASIHFSSNGSTHLVYAYTSHPSAQPLFETFIFIITIQNHWSVQ